MDEGVGTVLAGAGDPEASFLMRADVGIMLTGLAGLSAKAEYSESWLHELPR